MVIIIDVIIELEKFKDEQLRLYYSYFIEKNA